ncbi:hypothetical protein Tco_0961409, partial [Tanacetum coccineum]
MSTQQDINAIRAQRLANTHDLLALMANTQTPFHPDQSSLITYLQHLQPNNNFVLQPSFNTNYMQQPMQNPKRYLGSYNCNRHRTYCTTGYEYGSRKTDANVQNPGIQNVGNHNGLSVDPGIENQYVIGNVIIARAEGNGNGINGNQIRCYNCQGIAQNEAGIQLNYEEFDFMATAGTSDEIEEANVNCTLKDNLQQASTLGTQIDNAPVYYSDGSA